MLGPGHLDHAAHIEEVKGARASRRAEVRREVHVALQRIRAGRAEEPEQEVLPHIGVEWQVGEGIRHVADPHEPA